MHQLIISAPALFVVLVLFLSRQVELAVLLLIFDVIGAVGGVWWLQFSKRLADKVHRGVYHEKIHLKSVKIALVVLVLAAVVGTAFLFATLLKTVTAAATLDAQCVRSIVPQEWLKYAECLRNGSSCINPAMACK